MFARVKPIVYALTMKSTRTGAFLYFCLGLTLLSTQLQVRSEARAEKPDYNKKMQLGQLLFFNGNVDRAIKAFKDAAALKPDAFDPHFSLVNIYVQKGEFENAAEEARACLKLKPNHRDLHLVHGNLLRNLASSKTSDPEEQKRLLDEAVKALAEAERLGAKKHVIHSTLSVVHIQRGDLDKALEHCEKAIEENDKNPDAHLIRGILKFKKGEKDLALKEIDTAIEQKGKNAEARNTKGDILVGMGKHDEAMKEYEAALEDDGKYHLSMVGIANLLIQKQKWEEALKHLLKASEIKSGDANILYSVGVCYEKLGKIDDAVKYFNDGIIVDPNQNTKNQILMHVRQLQQKNFLGPGLMSPGGIGDGAVPGNQLFGPGSSFFNESFKDMIKIKPAGKKEGSGE